MIQDEIPSDLTESWQCSALCRLPSEGRPGWDSRPFPPPCSSTPLRPPPPPPRPACCSPPAPRASRPLWSCSRPAAGPSWAPPSGSPSSPPSSASPGSWGSSVGGLPTQSRGASVASVLAEASCLCGCCRVWGKHRIHERVQYLDENLHSAMQKMKSMHVA